MSRRVIVSFYHDIEQNIGHPADIELCRKMVSEFIKIENKYKIKCTYNVVGKIFKEQSDLVNTIMENNHEVAFHSYNHQKDWKPEYYENEIIQCRKESLIPVGYRSPRSQWNDITLKTLWDNKFLWNAENDNRKYPYFIHKGLIRIPISLDDWFLYTGEQSEESWFDEYQSLLKSKSYVSVGFHDFISSANPEKKLKLWNKVIEMALNSGALITNFSQTADLFRRFYVARFYTLTSKQWNKDTQQLYRTKRYKELISDEVGKIKNPVIADLGSGGGVLSAHLTNKAKKIYCVDNAKGMVESVLKDSNIEPILGEVTDSKIADNSVDFVIASRVIEYLYNPDDLANEIKRIGKKGGKFFVTFPANLGKINPDTKNPPDKIRRDFTDEQINKWVEQIGNGQLIGIQYKHSEPKTIEDENSERAIEKEQPKDIIPRNWVFIGNIEKEFEPQKYNKTIPLETIDFIKVNDRYERFLLYYRTIGKLFPKPLRKIVKRLLE